MYLGYLYIKDFSPFSERPAPAKTVEKKQTANGMGTLFNAIQRTDKLGTPLMA